MRRIYLWQPDEHRLMRAFAALALAIVGACWIARSADAGERTHVMERVVDLPLEHGLHQRLLYDAVAGARATLVMFPGGAGDVGVRLDGDLRHDDNFVVRTRMAWGARGYAVLIPDWIERTSLRGVRSSGAYNQIIQALLVFAHAHDAGPVFLLGTSQGSIAAMNGAAHAKAGQIAGLVLTESVSILGHSGETVFDADPQDVRVPALVVANRDDHCDVAPPGMAPRIAAALSHAQSVQVLFVSGGNSSSKNSCASLSPHGYYGIEASTIGAIGLWLRAHGG